MRLTVPDKVPYSGGCAACGQYDHGIVMAKVIDDNGDEAWICRRCYKEALADGMAAFARRIALVVERCERALTAAKAAADCFVGDLKIDRTCRPLDEPDMADRVRNQVGF